MKKIAEIWEGAQKDAQKIIGTDAALPYWPADPMTLVDEYNGAQDELEAATKTLVGWVNSQLQVREDLAELLSKLSKVASKADFGLNNKSKEDAKKIGDARAALIKGIGAMQKRIDTVYKTNQLTLEKALKGIK